MLFGNWIFEASETRPKIDLTTAVGLRYKVKDNFAIGAKMLYERKGASENSTIFLSDNNGTTGNAKITARYNFNYCTLPVTLQFTKGNKIKYTGEVGAFGAFLINSSVRGKSNNSSVVVGKENLTSNSKRFDAGLSFGFRTVFPLSEKMNFNVVLLDNVGLLNVFKSGNGPKTNALNLLFGVSFTL